MNAFRLNSGTPNARHLIDEAIALNGASRVLFAALLAVLRGRIIRKPRPPDTRALSAHLRRDIGLAQDFDAADFPQFHL